MYHKLLLIISDVYFFTGMMYPCRMHSELCVAMDTLSHHSGQIYPSDSVVEQPEINHHYYLDPNHSPVSSPHLRG